MKLKEKLAREHCIGEAGDQDATSTCMLCYLAGFEKGREMAANQAEEIGKLLRNIHPSQSGDLSA